GTLAPRRLRRAMPERLTDEQLEDLRKELRETNQLIQTIHTLRADCMAKEKVLAKLMAENAKLRKELERIKRLPTSQEHY
ncbi:MAG: hypothetical protein ACE5JS_20470, partial [Nitrospinota bacterium]